MVSIPWERLPLGYRFRPTDEELINHYLKRKIDGRINSDSHLVIPEVDVCKCEPWDLPDRSLIRSDDAEWFFFSPKDRKYPSGNRANRATIAGYWKATGKDRLIRCRNRNLIGTKKTLVFYQGRAPKGVRTHWIMHEYRTTEPEFESGDQGGFVLYRLFDKSDERNSSPSEIEGGSQSAVPALSSPGNTLNETDPREEFGTPPDQEIPSNLLDDQLAYRSSCSASLKQEESNCTSNAVSKLVDHELDMAGESEDQVVQNLLKYFSSDNEQPYLDDFPQIISPMQTCCKDSPVVSEMHQELCRELFPNNIAEQESNEFVGMIFNGQEGPSSQRGGREAVLESFHKQSLTPKDTLPEAHCELFHPHEIGSPEAPAFAATPLLNVVENEDFFFNFCQTEEEYPSLGLLGVSGNNTDDHFDIDLCRTEVKHQSQELLGVSGNTDDHLEIENTMTITTQQGQPGVQSIASTGIRINSRPLISMPESLYSTAQQGTTSRRLRLQTTPTRRNLGVRQYQSRSISGAGSFVGVARANLKWLLFIVLLMSGFVFCWYFSSVLFGF